MGGWVRLLTRYQLTHTYLSERLPCRVDHPSLEARAAGFVTDSIVLPVGAAAGPSHQPGKALEDSWDGRAADLIEPIIDSILSRCGYRPLSPADKAPEHGWACRAADLIEFTIQLRPQSVQPPVRPAWKANETGDPSD